MILLRSDWRMSPLRQSALKPRSRSRLLMLVVVYLVLQKTMTRW